MKHEATLSHSVRSFRKLLDYQFFILIWPSAHLPLRVHEDTDIISDSLLLFPFIVQRNGVDGQLVENRFDVGFEAASHAYTQIRKGVG